MANPTVNQTACKLRLQVPSALRAPAAGYLHIRFFEGIQVQLNFKNVFILISCALLSACSETIHWKEEVLLSAGQKIIINRSVERIPAELGHRRATTYEISGTNPSTGEKLNWAGDFGLGPVMLDFKDGYAFIVALPMMCDAKIKEFSIKGFPYIFMRSKNGKDWEIIRPNQFPTEYISLNLSAGYDPYIIKNGIFLSSENVAMGSKT